MKEEAKMRHIVYYSKRARTSGNWKDGDLMKAGRMDIVCHAFISALFLSHEVRKNVTLHLIFDGPPTPPRHLEFRWKGEWEEKFNISKKDVSGLIKRMLYKYKEGEKREVFPGCWIEKKSLLNLVKELKEKGKEIYILDKKGEYIRNVKLKKESVFIIGDHEGLGKELKKLKKISKLISLGKQTYFASQSIVILNYELDNLGL